MSSLLLKTILSIPYSIGSALNKTPIQSQNFYCKDGKKPSDKGSCKVEDKDAVKTVCKKKVEKVRAEKKQQGVETVCKKKPEKVEMDCKPKPKPPPCSISASKLDVEFCKNMNKCGSPKTKSDHPKCVKPSEALKIKPIQKPEKKEECQEEKKEEKPKKPCEKDKPILQCKLALIAGGMKDFSMDIAETMLELGAQAVEMVDVHSADEERLAQLKDEYGLNKIDFRKIDYYNQAALDGHFAHLYEKYQIPVRVFIGSMDGFNDANFERSEAKNVTGYTMMLLSALRHMNSYAFFPKCKPGYIITMLNYFGICPSFALPIYSAQKQYQASLVKLFGNKHFVDKTCLKVMGLALGQTCELESQIGKKILEGYELQGPAEEAFKKMKRSADVKNALKAMFTTGKSGELYAALEPSFMKIS